MPASGLASITDSQPGSERKMSHQIGEYVDCAKHPHVAPSMRGRLGGAVSCLIFPFELLGYQRMRVLRLHAGATVGACDDFQQVAVGILEIDTAPVVPMVDLVWPAFMRIGPEIELSLLDPREDLVKLPLAHEEGVVLRLDFALDMAEIERELVAYLHQRERTQHQGWVDAQQLAEEQSRSVAIARIYQGVVELDGHVAENEAAPPEVASCEGIQDSPALGRDMEERGRPRHINVRCHSAANRPEKPADRLQVKPAAGVEILPTLGQRGYKLALRHGKIGPMATLAIEEFIELELLQYASQLADCLRMKIDACVDVRVVRL